MAATYQPGSGAARDRLRMLIPDKTLDGLTPVAGVYALTSYLFLDAELDDFLAMEDGSVKLACAGALETIAGSELMVNGVVAGLGYKIDAAAVATELRERAKALREQVAQDEAKEDGGAFDIAEQVVDPFSARERLWKEWLRHG